MFYGDEGWSLEGVDGLQPTGLLHLQKLGMSQEVSIFVRVVRNLAVFSLPARMDKEERLEFERRINVAFNQLKVFRCGGCLGVVGGAPRSSRLHLPPRPHPMFRPTPTFPARSTR